MSLRLYNTLTRKKEDFVPIFDRNVRVYACGPTVYDHAHIGNARPIIVFDVLFRVLRLVYGKDHVTYVRNITDVDDKINARAAEEGRPIKEVTNTTTRQFHEDIAQLQALKPTAEPRATDHIEQMIRMIEILIEKGHAYTAADHVLFDVSSMPDYGRLSGRSVDDMIAGARVDVAPYKKGDMDYVLWKPSSADIPGWASPWGRGRPGWHIECSAMAKRHLGEIFDIHGGGIDLVFPHHENEIAQSRCAHGTDVMANVWMHNGYLQVEGEKMSKSTGNFFTIHDLLKKFPGEALRLNMLTTHYRQPFNWTEVGVRNAWATLDNWYKLTGDISGVDETDVPEEVMAALGDDLNTPRAITALHNLRQKTSAGDEKAGRGLKAGAQLMGLLTQSAEDWNAWKPEDSDIDEAKVRALLEARTRARENRDFAEADRLRDELSALGVTIKDGPDGTTWEIAR